MTREQALQQESTASTYDPLWFQQWRELVGNDLLQGYATLAYIPEHTRKAINEEQDHE